MSTVALVTGASSGIGAAISASLRQRGFEVARLDVAPPGDDAGSYFECDVRSPEAWARAMAGIRESMGEIGVAFLNAGVMSRPPSASLQQDPLELINTSGYHRVFDVNVHGCVYGLQAIVGSMRSANGGVIVVTASTAGLEGLSIDPFYAMTKHAVIGMVRSFAPVLERDGIRIHAICPGGVNTAIVPDEIAASPANLMDPGVLAAAAVALLDRKTTGEVWVKDVGDSPSWLAPVVRKREGGPAF